MRTLKVILVLVALLLASQAMGQVQVRYQWSQPDSTMAVQRDSLLVPSVPLQDGDIKEYNVFLATPTDTVQVAIVGAPLAIADSVTVLLAVPMGVPVSVAVTAIDQRDQEGPLSEWSELFTVYPGPPQAAGRPRATEVYIGG